MEHQAGNKKNGINDSQWPFYLGLATTTVALAGYVWRESHDEPVDPKPDEPVQEEKNKWIQWTLLVLMVIGIVVALVFYRRCTDKKQMAHLKLYPVESSRASSSESSFV